MSTPTPTPTSARPAARSLLDLPGQAHVAEGPLDLNGMYLAHHAFRRDLRNFAAAARSTPVEEAGVWRALAVRWEQFSGILHHHHTTEDDVLWPQLLDLVDAAGDADGRATLEAMESEHAVIDPMLAACAEGFAAMADRPDAATRDRLAECTATARDTLSDHMGHEERDALPLVQSLLSEEGWERVEKAAGEGKSARDLMFLVPWVADGLDRDQLETAYRSVGQAFRVMVALTRRRYARRDAVSFRFA
ncbi:UNVERIFIED_ORG: hemerythrin domain-containing protein [Bacillus sp. AZ43]